jgi:hypothetical protein
LRQTTERKGERKGEGRRTKRKSELLKMTLFFDKERSKEQDENIPTVSQGAAEMREASISTMKRKRTREHDCELIFT